MLAQSGMGDDYPRPGGDDELNRAQVGVRMKEHTKRTVVHEYRSAGEGVYVISQFILPQYADCC